MARLTLTQSAEIAAFAEEYAAKRFGIPVRVTVVQANRQRLREFFSPPLGAASATIVCGSVLGMRRRKT